MLPRPALAALALAAGLAAHPAAAQEVGRIGTDWTGNDIVVEAVADPKVEGVTCHLTYFSRGFLDRLM
ncbi:MAG: CreA family protein, partial [Rhodospirillales bacterium]